MSNKRTITDLSLKEELSKQEFLNYVREENQRRISRYHLWWWIQTSPEWGHLVATWLFLCHVVSGVLLKGGSFLPVNIPEVWSAQD